MVRLSLAALCVSMLFGCLVTYAPAADKGLDAETIRAGLRTASPEEDGFIFMVVSMTNDGRLPAYLVESTFLWARKKPDHRFQYFKRALTLRAAQKGIRLPNQ